MNLSMQVISRKGIVIAAFLAVAMTACDKKSEFKEEPAAMLTTISGSAAYQERIALTPGHWLKVTLSDIAMADPAAPVLAETSRVLGNEQVPLSFEIQVETDKLSPRNRYQVRAALSDPSGHLAWTTDTAYPIDPTLKVQDLGMLRLVKVDRSVWPQSNDKLTLPGTSWLVEDVASGGVIDNSNLSLSFDEDGRLNGSSGCNTFTGEFSVNENKLKIGKVAGTRMACPPALMDLEQKFLNVLSEAATYAIDSDRNTLTITAANGQAITASLISQD